MTSTNDRAKQLKALHVPSQPLILPNVWDRASLYTLLSLNESGSAPVKAVATASFAIAAALGVKDEDLSLEQNLDAVRQIAPICNVAGLPLTTDLQDGYGDLIAEVVTTAIEAGACGANIEDSIPSAGFGKGIAGCLYDQDEQVRRLKKALKAANDAGCPDFVLNARCDVFKLDKFEGLDDETRMKAAISRGKAYLDAGATTVFYWGGPVRGMRTSEVETLVKELKGRVAVLLWRSPNGHSTAELAKIGVARISIGPTLYLFAMNTVKATAKRILEGGSLIV